MKTLIILSNIGSPSELSLNCVKDYLTDFLMDQHVIDLPWLLRWILVHLWIIPRRSMKSLKAYSSIWNPNGNPFHEEHKKLKEGVQLLKKDQWVVMLAMRYGKPSLYEEVKELSKIYEKIIVVPLYPQFSFVTTGSTIDLLKEFKNILFFPYFFNHPIYLEVQSQLILKILQNKIDFLIFSYHGVPIRHILKYCKNARVCLKNNKCNKTEDIGECYIAQCYQTTQLLAKKLNLSPTFYTTTFQSRFSNDPWIDPFTEDVLVELAQLEKNVAVVSLSFVVDGLETIEEIGIRAKKLFLEHGGKNFYLVESLNHCWAPELTQMIEQHLQTLHTS